MSPVKVIIPIYKATLSNEERLSLSQAYQVLKGHPLVVVKPESLDLSELVKEFPTLQLSSFPDHFFQGISGYNRLMLSACFYECFRDCDYILIYQLDAYVFRDELLAWCQRGYDYVGAPWLKRKLYQWPVISWIKRLSKAVRDFQGKPSKQNLYDKVGNGGLSLRKVESHLRVLREQEERVNFYLAQKRHHLYNEDVFWATEPHGFVYPTAQEALAFAFDKYPDYCYELNDKKLPFGCHAWYKRKMRRFWMRYIPFPSHSN